MKKGFTLIEVTLYIALFSLLLGSALTIVYQLIDGSGKLGVRITTEEEGNFILRKLNWALAGISSITTPSEGTPLFSTLKVTKYDGNIIDVRLNANKIEIQESANGNTYLPITTDNVKVSSLNFQYLEAVGGVPAGVTTTTTINGIDFSITKYLRK